MISALIKTYVFNFNVELFDVSNMVVFNFNVELFDVSSVIIVRLCFLHNSSPARYDLFSFERKIKSS